MAGQIEGGAEEQADGTWTAYIRMQGSDYTGVKREPGFASSAEAEVWVRAETTKLCAILSGGGARIRKTQDHRIRRVK